VNRAETAAPGISAGVAAATPAGRDRATWLLYLQMAVFAYFLYCFGPSVPLLGDDQHVSKAVAGLHSTGYAVGGLIVGLLGSRPVLWWGRGPARWGSFATLAAGVLVYGLGPWPAVTITGAMLCGLGGFAVVNLVAAAVVDHHGPDTGPGRLSEAHGIGAAVGMVAPLAIGGTQASGLGWRYGMLATPLLIATLYALFRTTRIPGHDRVAAAAPTEHRTTPDHPLPRRYWWAWTVVVTAVAVEFSLSLWASDLLRDRAGLSEGAAATAMTAVVAGLCAGRLAGGTLALRFPLTRLYLTALAVNFAGFAVLWLSTVPWLSFAGLFVAGCGMSVQFPLAVARSIECADGRSDLATSRSALATALAAGGAPFLLGLLADMLDTRTAFLIVPVFLAAAVPALLLSGRTPAEPAG
jgi:predicted MFS family arabinose efflux permease